MDACGGPLVLVFLRAPQAGRVKTRLAAQTSAATAMEVYQQLVEVTVRAVAGAGLPCWICGTPAEAVDELRAWVQGLWPAAGEPPARWLDQGEGDLGRRLASAFDQAFAAGHRPVLAIGSDCPGLRPRHLTAAVEHLEQGGPDVVIGAALDGGYYLVGLERRQPGLFAGIRWSSEHTRADTLAAAEALALRVEEIEPLGDLDTLADWEAALAAGLLPLPAGAPRHSGI